MPDLNVQRWGAGAANRHAQAVVDETPEHAEWSHPHSKTFEGTSRDANMAEALQLGEIYEVTFKQSQLYGVLTGKMELDGLHDGGGTFHVFRIATFDTHNSAQKCASEVIDGRPFVEVRRQPGDQLKAYFAARTEATKRRGWGQVWEEIAGKNAQRDWVMNYRTLSNTTNATEYEHFLVINKGDGSFDLCYQISSDPPRYWRNLSEEEALAASHEWLSEKMPGEAFKWSFRDED